MRVTAHLTLEQLRDLAKVHCHTHRVWLRFQTVVLAFQGDAAQTIARALSVTVRSVYSWVADYNQFGPDFLLEGRHTGRRRRLDPDRYAELKQRIDAGPRPEDGVCAFRALDIQRILRQEFDVEMSLSGIYVLLERLKYSSLVPRPQHPEANPEVQGLFKETVQDQIDAIIDQHPDKEVEVFFQDEARMGQQGTVTRVWAEKGTTPRALKQIGYSFIYVILAVSAMTGACTGLIMDGLDTKVINAFLKQMSQELAPNRHAILIWDGAPWHVAKGVKIPRNISIIVLPPYSPELNPIERMWHYMRSHFWSNKVYEDKAALVAEAVESMNRVGCDPNLMKSVCAVPYICGAA
jgi:transposase